MTAFGIILANIPELLSYFAAIADSFYVGYKMGKRNV